MKFKLLASVLVLAVALTGVLGATAAMFSDTEDSTATVTAGILDLVIGENGKYSTMAANMKPGDVSTDSFKIANAGNINGQLIAALDLTQILNYEDGRYEPEIEAGDTTDTVGELSRELNLRITATLDPQPSLMMEKSVESATEVVLFEGSLDIDEVTDAKTLAIDLTPHIEYLYLDAGRSATISVRVEWPEQIIFNRYNDNLAQSDRCIIPIEFLLAQR
ncbi:MAG: TasA family protein [Eubacteriales bacterium]